MSKQVKQLELDALKHELDGVRDLVLLSISGVSAITENQMRLALRKKNIRMMMVKNSQARRVFKGLGIGDLGDHLAGPTTVAWGSSSIADLSKEIDAWVRKNNKVKPKTAVADGAIVPFEAAKKFPTRVEAIARIASLALAPAARLAGLLRGPGSTIAAQLKTIGEKTEEPVLSPP